MDLDWGNVVVQVTAIVGGLAALIAIINGVYQFREYREKARERRLAEAARAASPPQPNSSSTPAGSEAQPAETSSPRPVHAPESRRRTNLPAQPTGLIAREEELAELEELLLRPEVHLVTLTGPAGVGKTRLALQAAANLLDRYEDGVFFVPLASVADPDLVVPTIAQVLDVREQGNKPLLELLKDHLQEKRLLLLLDNFEQVSVAAGAVTELLAAPGLSIMVTSREVLHLYGENAFVVPPLALPEVERLSAEELVSKLAENEAVRLFVARAQAADSGFSLAADNAVAVAEIVSRLDGLPLAIELAAARIRLLPPEAMLQRLFEATSGSSLQVLTGGPRDLPARQQTLRNTIAWSYDLLDAAEQALFQRLGVFSGGWTLEAAEAVAAASRGEAGGDGRGLDVLGGLESLIGKSLVWQLPRGNRFMMLKTIRDYALEQLAKAGITGIVRQAHAGWYRGFVERAEPQLYGRGQIEWLQWLDAEQDNLRSALQWAVEGRQGEVALRLVACLSWYWNLRGRVSEGRSWLEAALAVSGQDHTPARAAALSGLAELVSNQGDWTTAWAALEESIALARNLDDRQRLARSLATLSLFRVRGAAGSIAETQALADESLALARSLGDPWILGYVLTVLDIRNILLGNLLPGSTLGEEALRNFEAAGDQWGVVLSLRHLGMGALARDDYPAARHYGERALAASRMLGDRLGEAYTLNTLADIARVEGDYDRATAYYEESVALYRDLGLRGDIPACLHNLGYVTLARGRAAEARDLQTRSLELHQEAGNKAGVLEAITGLAAVARAEGEMTRAARLFGAVEALRTAMAVPTWPAERVEYDRHVAALRNELDEVALREAWAEGRTLRLEQAVALALDAVPAGGGG